MASKANVALGDHEARLAALEEDKAAREKARTKAVDPDQAFVTRAQLRAALAGDTDWLDPEPETEPKGKGK